MLSRVLIRGEKFGRAAWQDRDARIRQQMLGVFSEEKEEEDVLQQEERLSSLRIDDEQPSSVDGKNKNEDENKKTSNHNEKNLRSDVKIVAIDLQPISPLAGITTLRADITHPATVPLLLSALDPEYADPKANDDNNGGGNTAEAAAQQASHPVDLVLSDGAPDVTGLHDLDIYVQSQLLFAALNLALCVLKPGGKFVAKIFQGRNVDVLFAQLKIFFEKVIVAKPRSSRASSVEAFIVCLNFRPPVGFRASLEEPLGVGHRVNVMIKERELQIPIISDAIMQSSETGAWDSVPVSSPQVTDNGIIEMEVYDETLSEDKNHIGEERDHEKSTRWIAPFIACGDLSAFDSDASYRLPEDYVSLDPVQPPIAPPYKRAVEMRAALSQGPKVVMP